MSFQSSVNSMIGIGAAAGKVKDIAPKGKVQTVAPSGGMNFQEMNSAMAFQKSNQGLIEEYTKKQKNLERSRNALTKMGRWGKQQENQLKFYADQIKRYQAVDTAVSGRIGKQMDKLAEEGKKDGE